MNCRIFAVLLFSFFVHFTTSFANDERPLITTKNGQIRGNFRLSTNGRRYAAFEGVPYAEPPLNELRFRESVPKGPWIGIWDATMVHQCLQVNHEPKDLGLVEGSEDCLYLNIYVPWPIKNSSKSSAVIVHFHSGAFMWGRGDIYGAKHLMDQDVVYINLNYRLGPLGFLSLEDTILPGNNGLKDQVRALEWIQENIAAFGGNSKSVTITGLSAGGASTHYHFLSPMSKGLFHRGISVSGTALDNWALVEHIREKSIKLGRILGCEQRKSEEFVECLRQRPASQIIKAVKEFQPWLYNPYTVFGPTVERVSGNERRFLIDYPYKIIEKGWVTDLPWITTVTSEEGLYPAAQFVSNETWLPHLEEHWLKIAPYNFHYDSSVDDKEKDQISQKIKKYYLKDQQISRKTFSELVQAIGDRLFVVDSEKAAKLQAKVNTAPVFYYRFSYRGDHSYSEYFAGTEENFGVCHADDLMYIMSPDPSWFSKYMQSDKDKKISEILTNIWMSFIKNNAPSVPGVFWERVSTSLSDRLKYLHIASVDSINLETTESLGHGKFWNSLAFQENDKLNLKNVASRKTEF